MALLAFFATNIVGLFGFFAFILLYIPPCSPSLTSFKQLQPVALTNGVIHVHVNISMEEIYADFYTINDAMDKILAAQHTHPHHYSKPMTSILTDAAIAQVALHDALTDLWEMPFLFYYVYYATIDTHKYKVHAAHPRLGFTLEN